jgi:hypothetical protein
MDFGTPENGWSEQEAGMAQLDDVVGAVMQKLKDLGVDDNTIVVFTTDNGPENFTWPHGGHTPFAGGKGKALEGGFRVPAMVRWPGHVPVGTVENGIFSGMDWFPTLVAAAGDPNIAKELKAGKNLAGQNYKVHLDGYNQLDLITGKVDWPILTNLRLDPFERTGLPSGDKGSLEYTNWFTYQFWRFVYVQQVVGQLAQTAIEFPPMQKGASFNLEVIKEQIAKKMAANSQQSNTETKERAFTHASFTPLMSQ